MGLSEKTRKGLDCIMVLSSRKVLEIISDEEKFVRHSCPNYKKDAVTLIDIPKNSFTAIRLLNASPVEISLSSKVVLVGGVPALWYDEQRVGFRKFVSSIGSRKIDRDTRKLDNYGYRLMYKKAGSHTYGEEHASNKPSTPGSSTRTAYGPSPRRQLKETKTLATELRVASPHGSKPIAKLQELQHKVRQSKTVPVLPTLQKKSAPEKVNYRYPLSTNHDQRNVDYESSVFDDFESSTDLQSSLRPSNISMKSSMHSSERKVPIIHPFRENSCNRYDYEDKPSTITMQVPESGIDSALQEGDSVSPSVSNYKLVSPEASDDTARQSQSGQEISSIAKNRAITFADKRDTNTIVSHSRVVGSYSSLAVRKLPLVRLKTTTNSKVSEVMRVLDPSPEETDCSLNKNELVKFTASRRHIKRHKGVSGKVLNRLKKEAEELSQLCYSPHHNLVQRLRSGVILFAGRVLVMQKIAVDRKEPLLHFSEVEPIDTRVAERWKEYFVIVRSTNLSERPVFIQFYKGVHAPKNLDKGFKRKAKSMDFFLDMQCKIDFYSNLDKTICVQKPDNKYSGMIAEGNDPDLDSLNPLAFYIFRCRTLHDSSKLYEMLRKYLGIATIPKELVIRVPDADISVGLKFTKDIVNKLFQLEANESERLILSILRRGYKVFQNPLMRYINIAVVQELKQSHRDVLKQWDKSNVILGCCFKRYDLLQWSSGSQNALIGNSLALCKSHLLEYRSYTQIPRLVKVGEKSILVEPTAVEGFLIQLTNKYGKEKTSLGKFFLQPSFLFTVDNLLFYMKSNRVSADVPFEKLFQGSQSKTSPDETKQMLMKTPNVCEHDPYPLDLSGHINWLKDKIDARTFEENDLFAFKSFNRRVIQIMKAEGMIDMTEIVNVFYETVANVEGCEIKYQLYSKAKRAFWRHAKNIKDDTSYLVCAVTANGLILKLLAPNKTVCEEWVTRLQGLIKYWKGKRHSESEKSKALKIKNFRNLKLDEEEESNINGNTPKWLTDRGVTDSTIYNANALSGLRPSLQKGLLYQKPKKHSIFSRYFVILIPGFLTFYHAFHRSSSGVAKNVLNHSHYLTIPLEGCYIYSGATTELDLLKRDHTFDEINPGSHSLPRYYSDGWRSTEDETSRCFTLWFGKKRTFHTVKRRNEVESKDGGFHHDASADTSNNEKFRRNPSTLTLTKKLGVTGRSMVFMARSRQERDLWVLSIYYELERLARVSADFL